MGRGADTEGLLRIGAETKAAGDDEHPPPRWWESRAENQLRSPQMKVVQVKQQAEHQGNEWRMKETNRIQNSQSQIRNNSLLLFDSGGENVNTSDVVFFDSNELGFFK